LRYPEWIFFAWKNVEKSGFKVAQQKYHIYWCLIIKMQVFEVLAFDLLVALRKN
jgi:hypothetical protein